MTHSKLDSQTKRVERVDRADRVGRSIYTMAWTWSAQSWIARLNKLKELREQTGLGRRTLWRTRTWSLQRDSPDIKTRRSGWEC